ncbi:PQQ-binding-like beta-propeller repeat protein [Streptomyces sp. NPDC049915]|uniref:outer membrane protein assembly factor BamB family protein n=1 Tax=Streptomyces sp. NPDC049915 TaxID=3155510 RepID=UPI0034463D8D
MAITDHHVNERQDRDHHDQRRQPVPGQKHAPGEVENHASADDRADKPEKAGRGVDHLPSVGTGTDGVLYTAEQTGTLSALDAATGTRLWSVETHATVKNQPVVTKGVIPSRQTKWVVETPLLLQA